MNEELILNEKTGFKIVGNNPVIIYDSRGKIFYDNREIKNPSGMFNLPAGKYSVFSGDFIRMRTPVFYRLNPLPLPERNKKFPENFDVVFEDNPHKATINWTTETISFDKSLLNASLPTLYFILFHEFGHHKFRTEKLADAYAENQMILRGFNPSQIAGASILSLSDRQVKRKTDVVKRLFSRL